MKVKVVYISLFIGTFFFIISFIDIFIIFIFNMYLISIGIDEGITASNLTIDCFCRVHLHCYSSLSGIITSYFPYTCIIVIRNYKKLLPLYNPYQESLRGYFPYIILTMNHYKVTSLI